MIMALIPANPQRPPGASLKGAAALKAQPGGEAPGWPVDGKVRLMQTFAKDDSPDMSAPRAALLKRLEEVATKEWLAVLRGE